MKWKGGGKEGITDQCNESTVPTLTKPDCRDIAAFSSSVPSEVGGGGKEGITDQCNVSTVPTLTKPDCRDIAAISSSVPSEVGEGGKEGGGGREKTPSVDSSGYGGSREASPDDEAAAVVMGGGGGGGIITEDMVAEEERLREREQSLGGEVRERESVCVCVSE